MYILYVNNAMAPVCCGGAMGRAGHNALRAIWVLKHNNLVTYRYLDHLHKSHQRTNHFIICTKLFVVMDSFSQQ